MTNEGRILLVDDQRVLCDTIRDRLEHRLQVSVDAFYDGDTALERLIEPGPNFYKIVILDMFLPRPGRYSEQDRTLGVRLLRAHHLLVPGTPVIVYTAHETYQNCVECVKAGAYDYIPKTDKESGAENFALLLERCRQILNPAPDELDDWVRQFGEELVMKFAGMYVGVVPLRDAEDANVDHNRLGDNALITGRSMGEVQLKLLMNSTLRWSEPKILRVPPPA